MRRLYIWLLYLFPRSYRLEYGEELRVVFNLSFDEARSKGISSIVGLVLREVISLPGAILYEHLRERSRMSGKFMSYFDFVPGSRKEVLAGMAPFLLFGAVPVFFRYLNEIISLPLWLQIAIVLFMGFWVGSLYVIGFARHIPRWFLAYLGLPLPVISLFTFSALFDPNWRGFPFLYGTSWYVRQFVHQGLIWGTIILVIILLVLVSMILPVLQPFYRRIRADWTLLCFLLYGAMPFLIVFLFDEYKDEELFLVLSFLTLAGGAWLYLRGEHLLTKFLSLFGGMTLAMLSTVLGQSLLYESSFPFTSFPEWTTTMGTAITWIWFTLFMLLLLTINLLPRVDRVEKTGVYPMPENS